MDAVPDSALARCPENLGRFFVNIRIHRVTIKEFTKYGLSARTRRKYREKIRRAGETGLCSSSLTFCASS